jgi:hypothetical protein
MQKSKGHVYVSAIGRDLSEEYVISAYVEGFSEAYQRVSRGEVENWNGVFCESWQAGYKEGKLLGLKALKSFPELWKVLENSKSVVYKEDDPPQTTTKPKHITVRLSEEEYKELLAAQLAYSQEQGKQVSLNAFIKAKILPSATSK